MKNKRYIFVLLCLAAAIQVPLYATSSTTASSLDALSLYSLRVSPNPIFAGSNIIISLQLYNSYTSTLQNVNLELEGSYPILNVSPSNPYLISSIGQGLYGGTYSFFRYDISIPKTAESGNYTLDLVATYQTVETVSGTSTTVTGTSVMPIAFYVHGIPSISISPSASQISPGKSSSVTLDVMNSGYGTARNMSLEILNTSEFSVTGTEMFSIGSLSPGGSESLSAEYIASRYIRNGTYALPVRVGYYSDQGTLYNQTINQMISVRVQNPNVVVFIGGATPQTLYSGYNQSLSIDVENIGLGDAKNVSVEILPGNGTSILSSVKSFFIANLSAGQSEEENLLVAANNSIENASLRASIDYYSENYQAHFSKNQSLGLNIAQSSIFRISGGSYSLKPGATSVPVNYTITNTGNIDAQQIQLSFQSSYPITPIVSSAYIPGLKPGQSAHVTFVVSIDSHGVEGSYPVTIYESWRQPNGAVQQSYAGSNNYYAEVGSVSSGTGGSSIYIAAAILIVAAFLAYRFRSRSKKKVPKAL